MELPAHCLQTITPLSSSPGEDPAIQVGAETALRNLDHRVTPLRVGPVMTEWNKARNNGRRLKAGVTIENVSDD
ncbi:MAG: hypothetical protein ACREEP_11765 [Dongiaceae bacterium]